MIVNGAIVNRKYGRPKATVAVRRQVAANTTSLRDVLTSIERPVLHFILAVLVVVIGGSQFISWRVGKLEDSLERIQSQQKVMSNNHIELRSKRAQLKSKKHIQAVAGVRLGLFSPEKGQVIKM